MTWLKILLHKFATIFPSSISTVTVAICLGALLGLNIHLTAEEKLAYVFKLLTLVVDILEYSL